MTVTIKNYVTARHFSLIPTLLPGGEGLCIPLPPGEGPRVREICRNRYSASWGLVILNNYTAAAACNPAISLAL